MDHYLLHKLLKQEKKIKKKLKILFFNYTKVLDSLRQLKSFFVCSKKKPFKLEIKLLAFHISSANINTISKTSLILRKMVFCNISCIISQKTTII